jgi:predicted esterase
MRFQHTPLFPGHGVEDEAVPADLGGKAAAKSLSDMAADVSQR